MLLRLLLFFLSALVSIFTVLFPSLVASTSLFFVAPALSFSSPAPPRPARQRDRQRDSQSEQARALLPPWAARERRCPFAAFALLCGVAILPHTPTPAATCLTVARPSRSLALLPTSAHSPSKAPLLSAAPARVRRLMLDRGRSPQLLAGQVKQHRLSISSAGCSLLCLCLRASNTDFYLVCVT